MIFFITGNKNKYEEVKAILGSVEQLDIDLPEIQSLSSQEIIEHKLNSAFQHHNGEFIVEDNSLILSGMNGMPGPLIKWYLKSIGNEGLVKLAKVFGNKAEAKVVFGYAKNRDNVSYFEGVITGTIVTPRGDKGFGWDPIFQPDGYNKTFGEMDFEEKNQFSMRRIALEKLKTVL